MGMSGTLGNQGKEGHRAITSLATLFVLGLGGCANLPIGMPSLGYELPAIPMPTHYLQAAMDQLQAPTAPAPTRPAESGAVLPPPATAPVQPAHSVPAATPTQAGETPRREEGGLRAPSDRPAGRPADDASLKPAVSPNSHGAWWRDFGSAELNALIDRGLANNQDMRIALQRMVQVKARADQAQGGRKPTISTPLVIADQSAGSASVGTAPTGGAGTGGTTLGSLQKTYQASVRADWRLDIWGEQSALADSAQFQLQRAVYERDNVERNLVASLAANYIEVLSLNDRRRLAMRTDGVMSATLTTIERRVAAGDATLAELEQQKAAIFSIRATLPALEQQRLDAVGTLAFLVGTVPGALQLADAGLDSLAVPVAEAGLPSELLLRRPDIRMAEAQLRGADADIAVARARLLPPMDLSAQLGRVGATATQLLLPQTLFINLVDSLTVSLFDGDRKKNDEVFSRAVHEEMVESYVRTIHQAMREVESALASQRLSRERMGAEQETLDSAHRAWDISSKIYKVGGADYLTLLDTQRTYHRYLDDYQQGRVAYFRSYINLMQALGGGQRYDRALETLNRTQAEAGAGAGAGELKDRRLGTPAECTHELPIDPRPDGSEGAGWRVLLSGITHCSTVHAAWRDLQARYGAQLVGRRLHPELAGRIEAPRDGEQSWYHLSLTDFPDRAAADALCRLLQRDQQRCELVAPKPGLASGQRAAQLPSLPSPDGKHATRLASAQGLETRSDTTANGAADTDEADRAQTTPLQTSDRPQPADATRLAFSSADDLNGLPVPDRLPDADTGTRPASRAPVTDASTRAQKSASLNPRGRYLQLGVFHTADRADALRNRAVALLGNNGVTVSGRQEGMLTRVLAGPFKDADSQRDAAHSLRAGLGTEPSFVTH